MLWSCSFFFRFGWLLETHSTWWGHSFFMFFPGVLRFHVDSGKSDWNDLLVLHTFVMGNFDLNCYRLLPWAPANNRSWKLTKGSRNRRSHKNPAWAAQKNLWPCSFLSSAMGIRCRSKGDCLQLYLLASERITGMEKAKKSTNTLLLWSRYTVEDTCWATKICALLHDQNQRNQKPSIRAMCSQVLSNNPRCQAYHTGAASSTVRTRSVSKCHLHSILAHRCCTPMQKSKHNISHLSKEV